MKPLDNKVKLALDAHLRAMATVLDSNVITIISPIVAPLDNKVRSALSKFGGRKKKKDRVTVILQTDGGVVEVCQRMVEFIREKYNEVWFIVPDRAMSAGTVFALSGDKIFMDAFSRLGPIDPQLQKNGTLIPALSYLRQYERLNEKSRKGEALTTVEYGLAMKLDLAELDQYQEAKNLSIELLETWLSSYKFKDWETTETRKLIVTDDLKKQRAREIAGTLSDTERWHSHSRGISIKVLSEELNLRIDDLEKHSVYKHVSPYFELIQDYFQREEYLLLIHTTEVFDGIQAQTRFSP